MNVKHILFLFKAFQIYDVGRQIQILVEPEAYITWGSSLKIVIIMNAALDAVLWEWPVPGRYLNL